MAVYVGDLLTASAAPVSGKPTPTRTWQWLRGSTAISGATSSTYTVAEADLGETLSVKQIETNIAGNAEATSLAVGPVETFTVASLFASGEEGAWYEPSTTTAFRSTTDLTPCGYGDSCGFLLDLSKGAGYSGGSFTGLGSELVTNGTFDTDATGWTATFASAAVSSGQVTLTRDGSGSGGRATLHQSVTVEVGKTYRAAVLFQGGTTSEFGVAVGTTARANNLGLSSLTPPSVGEEREIAFTATATTVFISIYSDTVGTVTAVFDNISVRELPGNHATQSSEPARPILARVPSGGRRNLLERTEEFDNAYWDKQNSSITPNAINSPIGALEADKIVESAVLGEHLVRRLSIGTGQKTASVYFKAAERTQAAIYFFNATDGVSVTYFDLSSGTVLSGAGIIEAFSDGWYRCSLTRTATAGDQVVFAAASGGSTVYTGDGTSGVYIWGAQLEAASSASAYQRVVDQYDITEAGVTSLEYLAFDGSDDGMATASIDFTATDKMSVFAGLENEGTSLFDLLVEFGNTSAGGFVQSATWDTNQKIGVANYNLPTAVMQFTVGSPPVTYVSAAILDRAQATAADEITFRKNGVELTGAQGGSNSNSTGNYGNLPLHIGSRNGTSLFFDGKLFSLIVRGAASTAGEISGTESYIANLTGVTLP